MPGGEDYLSSCRDSAEGRLIGDALRWVGMLPGECVNYEPVLDRISAGDDPCHYHIELVGPNNAKTLETLLILVDTAGIKGVTRVVGTLQGLDELSDNEIASLAAMARDWGIEFIATPVTPTQGVESAGTPQGAFFGLHMTAEMSRYYLKQMMRGVELGLRNFLIWDAGTLDAAHYLRDHGDIPEDVRFKASIFAGSANPHDIVYWSSLGASSINPRALTDIGELRAMRMICPFIPLDVHLTTLGSMGGLDRIAEAHEIIDAAAPMNAKFEYGAEVADLMDERKLIVEIFPGMIAQVKRFLAHMGPYPYLKRGTSVRHHPPQW